MSGTLSAEILFTLDDEALKAILDGQNIWRLPAKISKNKSVDHVHHETIRRIL
jgi:hypothetical protein